MSEGKQFGLIAGQKKEEADSTHFLLEQEHLLGDKSNELPWYQAC